MNTRRLIFSTCLLILCAGCATKPIDKKNASTPEIDRVFDISYLQPKDESRPVHVTRDSGIALSGYYVNVLIDDKPVVSLDRGESIELFLSPGVFNLKADLASKRLDKNGIQGSPHNYPSMAGRKGENSTILEIDTRPEMRFNVRIGLQVGISNAVMMEYQAERLIRR